MKVFLLFVLAAFICPSAQQDVSFTQKPDNITYAIYGRNATFTCRYKLERQAKLLAIVWNVKSKAGSWLGVLVYQNGRLTNHAKQPKAYKGRVYGMKDGTFVIFNATFGDSNEYRCGVSSLRNQISAYTNLVVANLPTAHVEEIAVNCGKGVSTKVICNVTGTPIPSIHWFKNGSSNPLVSGAKYEIVTSGSSSELQIKSCTDEDRGGYTCKAHIGTLKPSTAYFFVGVLTLVQKNDSCSLAAYQAKRNQPIIICCPVFGYPELDVTWELSNGSVVKTKEALITIIPKEKGDFGTCNCTARNPVIDKVQGPFMITLTQDEEADSFEVKREGNNILKWDEYTDATDYLVRLLFNETGEVISILSQQPKVEILRSSLKSKSGKPFPNKVSFNVIVLAIKEEKVIGKGSLDGFESSGAVLLGFNFRTIFLLFVVVWYI